MTWNEVCEDPALADLPYKIELNRFGQIIMSPAKNDHYLMAAKTTGLLRELAPAGQVFGECAVQTSDGVKAPDAAWISRRRFAAQKGQPVFTTAPEICVEVLSRSNSRVEMEGKRSLYFARGAEEAWEISAKGAVSFYGPEGKRETSLICPKFPRQLPGV